MKQTKDFDIGVIDAPVIAYVDRVLRQAVEASASDIHFEPFDGELRIRYRVDGALLELESPPMNLALSIISRLKVMANLNIAECRVPQDGRVKLEVHGRVVDVRVSTLPTQFGESVVLRILDKAVVNLDLAQLGMPEEVLAGVRACVARPNGIFIATGPTGSGKTTTLYSALREANRVGVKILTAEDPVEYEVDGLMQVSINPAIGLSFAKALRAFLRQDPDMLLVGEVRDLETARIAVQASLTGHVVLTTLHTNDAPGAVTRLVDLGVEPYLVAAALEGVLAQRLVRCICEGCKVEVQADDGDVSCAGKGCERCKGSGYRGRMGLFELMMIDDEIRGLISSGASLQELRGCASRAGMQTLRAAGMQAVADGKTTVDEVLRYT